MKVRAAVWKQTAASRAGLIISVAALSMLVLSIKVTFSHRGPVTPASCPHAAWKSDRTVNPEAGQLAVRQTGREDTYTDSSRIYKKRNADKNGVISLINHMNYCLKLTLRLQMRLDVHEEHVSFLRAAQPHRGIVGMK